MSSYTKRMIEIAADWLKVNPDPADPFLRIPNLGKNKSRFADDMTDDELARYERRALQHPELRPHVDELKRLTQEIRDVERDSREREDVIERVLNKVFAPGQSKIVFEGTADETWTWLRNTRQIT